MSSALLLLLLVPQDLFERDLARRLAPDVDLSGLKPKRASIELSAGADFACGSFDFKTSFKSLFDRNVKEEFLGSGLGGVQRDLAGSALVLACYASPTVCDAIKHYRVSAGTMLGMEMDACRSLEGAVEDGRRRSQARAIKECLEEKARQGVPLHEARRACARADRIPGLDGRPVKEIDLNKELGIPESLMPPLTLGAGSIRGESRPAAVAEAYDSKRRACLEAWATALADPSRAPMERLGPVSRSEVELLALMDPARREVALRSVASATALADLVREAHEAERSLEAAELAASPEVREELQRRRTQLRAEISRLTERFESERRLNAAVADAQAVAEADVAERARKNLAPRRIAEVRDAALEAAKPWGCEVKRKKEDRP